MHLHDQGGSHGPERIGENKLSSAYLPVHVGQFQPRMVFVLPGLKSISGLKTWLFVRVVNEKSVEQFVHYGRFLISVEGQDIGVTDVIEAGYHIERARVFLVAEERDGFSLRPHVRAIARVDQHLIVHGLVRTISAIFGDGDVGRVFVGG